MVLRRLLLPLLAVVLVPLPAVGGEQRSARLDGWLQDRLPTAGAPLRVYVHADTAQHARAAAEAAGLSLVETFDKVGVAVADGPAPAIRRVLRQKHVTYVEGDRPAELHLENSDAATRNSAARGVLANAGHDLSGAGVSIAVIDTGVDGTHPFFRRPDGKSKVVANHKAVCHDVAYVASDDPPNTSDTCWAPVLSNDSDSGSAGGHGTHVAGIAAGVPRKATLAGLGAPMRLAGAAPASPVVALSVGQARSVYGGSTGLNWVLEHHRAPCGEPSPACPPIRVVNNSYGVSGGSKFNPASVTAKLQRALVREGVVVVWSAGNAGGDGSGKDAVGQFQGTNGNGNDPTPGIVMVASYDASVGRGRDGTLSSFSSRGTRGSFETYPDVAAPGTYVLSSCRPWLASCDTAAFHQGEGPEEVGGYARLSGTSMAAPYVTGIVAELLSLDPRLTPGQVESALEDGAHRFSAGAQYEPDPANPGSPTSFDKGHGLVDVLASAELVLRGGVPDHTEPALPPYVPYDAGPTTLTCSTAFTDAADDATTSAPFFVTMPNRPALDLRAGRWSWDGRFLTATIVVQDVGALRTPGTQDEYYWQVTPAGGPAFQLLVRLGSLAGSYVSRGSGLAVPLSSTVVDRPGAGADEIRVSLRQTDLDALPGDDAVLQPGLRLTTSSVVSKQVVGLLPLIADTAAPGSCAYLLGAKDRTEPAPRPPGRTGTRR